MSTIKSKKPVVWIGNSLDDLKKFPEEVQGEMGYALYLAQTEKKHISAKALKDFGGAGVLEIVTNFDSDTTCGQALCRAVYTVKKRLKRAKQHHQDNYS